MAYLYRKHPSGQVWTFDSHGDSLSVAHLLDSLQHRSHQPVRDAWKAGRFLEDAYEVVASEAWTAARRPICFRHQFSGTLSRGSDGTLESKEISGRIEIMMTLSDQVAAVMSLSGNSHVMFSSNNMR
jgi:hypothetical protein